MGDIGTTLIPPSVRRLAGVARVGHFATSNGREPTLVPVCFVLLGATVYQAIDAKPKARPGAQLRRIRDLRRNRNAAFLIDEYTEDWQRLWYVLFRGRARILESGEEHRRAIAALRRKYPQYRDSLPLAQDAIVIALDVGRLTHWRSSSRGRRREVPPSRQE